MCVKQLRGIVIILLGSLLFIPAVRAAQQGGDTGTPPSGGGGGSPPDTTWHAYGNVVRGSNYYGNKAFLGLAAKGNIVIGNYTAWDDVPRHPVYEMIDRDGIGDTTLPYVLPDDTDTAIGYGRDDPSLCGGKSPCFSGNYTALDGGERCAGNTKTECTTPAQKTSRKYYESSLSDEVFLDLVADEWAKDATTGTSYRTAGSLVDPIPCFGGEATGRCVGSMYGAVFFWATLYTNHGLIGDVGRSSWIGSWAARDDAMRFQGRFDMTYDWRLQDRDFAKLISLPMDIAPAKVVDWQEVPSP